MTARWALIGQEGEDFCEFAADLLAKRSPYEVSRRNSKIYFRTSFEDKVNEKQIRISQQITKKNFKEKSNYRLLNHTHPLYKGYLNQLGITDAQFSKIDENIDKPNGFHTFQWFSKYLLIASDKQAVDILRDKLAPRFFDLHPNGKVFISSIDGNLNQRLAALRVLGAIDRIGSRNIKSKDSFVNFLALEGTQPGGVVKPSKYLAIPLTLSLPKPIGFFASRIVDSILFLFDNPLKDIRGVFPRSGIEFYQSEASLLLHEDKSIMDDQGVLRLNFDTLDTFSLLKKEFSPESWWNFIKQYSARLNEFFIYITDPSNFVKENGEWANITHYFVYLGFERLCDETILLISEENQYLRKMAFFRILDQLAFLGKPKERDQAQAFGELLLPTGVSDPIKKGLSRYRGELAKYLLSELDSIREDLINTVVDSAVLDKMKDLKTQEIILLSGKRVSYEEYTRKIIRALRNTAHGYSPGEYLVTNKGNLPDKISLLAVLALFAFIAEPKDFLRPTWNE
ncbi:MAG: hypothetical protein ACYC6R_04235 [Anaerolineales bacterium]